ncbi:MAG TPA: HAD hydrolase family protein [Anaerohalosphaeraceae bacterium]|jgi:3-deoxy-D-manno-octulosonate 8-phosphate phosphatase (KDO 8-P phosphatase)|nr:HAD hydrolase family protein [Anaerohalosphaeraceae bacterium]HRT50859.1 HAD hydrolase family protein [Anaerohalosphaeraceae bacterium]HRT86703.1 HAD hydrolase family protein [Anaerohalosphaeraceae bacterium]
MTGKPKSDLNDIRLLVLDVDGVLTDGTVILSADGSEAKRFNLHDGHGIKLWHRAGLQTAFISGREAKATTVRAEQLNITYVMQGQMRKLPAFESLLAQADLEARQAAYVGDDLLDLPVVVRAGLGVAVANAVEELKAQADMVTKRNGGDGAVREVIEYILKSTGRWQALMERYEV